MIGENGNIAALGRGWVQFGGPLRERGGQGHPLPKRGGVQDGTLNLSCAAINFSFYPAHPIAFVPIKKAATP